jgi:hypothetical protein
MVTPKKNDWRSEPPIHHYRDWLEWHDPTWRDRRERSRRQAKRVLLVCLLAFLIVLGVCLWW